MEDVLNYAAQVLKGKNHFLSPYYVPAIDTMSFNPRKWAVLFLLNQIKKLRFKTQGHTARKQQSHLKLMFV
jgi:hypothetical protein